MPDAGENSSSPVHKVVRDHPIYGLDWSANLQKPMRLGISSFSTETSTNNIEILSFSPSTGTFREIGKGIVDLPLTKVQFIPDYMGNSTDIICSVGEKMQFWKIEDDNYQANKLTLSLECKTSSEITSMDWSTSDINRVGTCSTDSTCTIWDVTQGTPTIQLIAHDSQVYDIAFSPLDHVFASCGHDGSIRMFDTRSLDSSTVLFGNIKNSYGALLKLRWNMNDYNYISTISADSKTVMVLDIRMGVAPIARLDSHTKSVNGIVWAPHSSCHLASCADDGQALIWDLAQLPVPYGDAYLSYNSNGPISNIAWSTRSKDYVAVTVHNVLEILKV